MRSGLFRNFVWGIMPSFREKRTKVQIRATNVSILGVAPNTFLNTGIEDKQEVCLSLMRLGLCKCG